MRTSILAANRAAVHKRLGESPSPGLKRISDIWEDIAKGYVFRFYDIIGRLGCG
jgi:hypothetical protein